MLRPLLVGILVEMLHAVVAVGLVELHVLTVPFKAPLSIRTNRFLEGGPATLDNNRM